MIKCLCVNDKNKPKKIPSDKWVKEGEEYTIIFASIVLPQKELAFQLEEIDLDESCSPYTYFSASRFALTDDGVLQMPEFIKECGKLSTSLSNLTEYINHDSND
jgi:hypothetical protein